MATMGLKYVAWSKMATEPSDTAPTYNTGLVIGKAVSSGLAISNAEAELYANDMLAEYVSEFSSAMLSMEIDNIALANQAVLYGTTFVNDELQFNAEDSAPYGGVGGYQILMVGGVRKYRAWFFPKAKAAVPDWAGTTKGKSITLGTQPMKMKIMAPNYGPWYCVKEFVTEAAAKAYIDTRLNVAGWHAIDIQVQGANGTKYVSQSGTAYAAAASVYELAITGTPTALYDNGINVLASITGGKYTLANVTADHAIAVIF